MTKKWIITLALIIVACGVAYFIYDAYNKNQQTVDPRVTQQERSPGTTVPPRVLSAEQKAILSAVIAKMTSVMESKNAKKIREFNLSLYANQADKDALSKIPDSQLIQSAQMFKEFDIGNSISLALTSLPDTAWKISGDTATITQESGDGRKAVFTATKVKGVWQ